MIAEKKELYTATKKSGIDCTDPEIQDTWATLRDDTNDINWLLLEFKAPTLMGLRNKGNDGLNGLIASLSDSEILFGAIKVNINNMIKFYHIFFVGSEVTAMKKGKSGMFKAGILQSLEGGHGELTFTDGLEGATYDTFISQLVKLTGKSASEIII